MGTTETISFSNKQGEELHGVLELPKGEHVPLVILGHGFGGDSNNSYVLDVAKGLVQHGIASLRMDFSGHGKSEGNYAETTLPKWKDDLLFALEYVRSRKEVDQSRIGLFGFSLSGGAVILVGAEENVKTVCAAAAVSDFETVDWKSMTGISIEEWKKKGSVSVDGEQLLYNFYDSGVKTDVYAAAKKITARTLVLHGEKDPVVPPAQSQKLYDTLSGKKTINFIKGAGHGDMTPEQYTVFITRILEWFALYVV
jgi:uncharacterized protein